MAKPARLPAPGTCTVLVVGDVMLDRYVRGEVRRISPEAPIPVFSARERRAVAGGAANVAVNLAALGLLVRLVGVIGDDGGGGDLRAVLGALADGLVTVTRPTTVKTRFVAGTQQMLRLDEEDASALDAAEEDAVLAAVTAALPGAAAVILSDYAKGVLTDRVLAGVIAAARMAGIPVVADPKRERFGAYRGVAVLTPNESEVTRATGIAAAGDAGAVAAAEAARAQADAGAVLLTRAARGLTLVQKGAPPLHLPTRAREVADVSGAGDTLVAAFTAALAGGADLAGAAALGNVAAGVVVGKPGTATVSRAELDAAVHEGALLAIDAKVFSRADLMATVAVWRAAGLVVGFTNGCFDLIHPGHVRLLARARELCDRLVVALNTDASVARLKGPSRPVQSETARATVMAAIGAVDAVTLFGEDTPRDLIVALRPDRLFKGADYTVETVVGADLVGSWGGYVELIPLEPGQSTTGTIRRIAGS